MSVVSVAGNNMSYLKTSIFIMLFLACHGCFSRVLQPISSEFGVCIKSEEGLKIQVSSPVDVEFASLIYRDRVVGQFEITILGPIISSRSRN